VLPIPRSYGGERLQTPTTGVQRVVR
jgi:hypothetical protein